MAMVQFLFLLISITAAYIIGSIPTSYILGRLLKGIDIREQGSGNVGATNTFRVLGKIPGIIVLFWDTLKGTIAVVLLAGISYHLMAGIKSSGTTGIFLSEPVLKIILGLAAIAGHVWTVFLNFRGGKGVATSAGVLIGLDPLTVGIAVVIFILVFVFTRYVSLGSITAAACLPILIVVRGIISKNSIPIPFLIFSMIISMVVIYRHKSNIGRLLRGEENKIVFKSRTKKA